jgi:Na+-driven multidrug efflux pump
VGANVLNLVLAVLLVYGPGQAPPIFAWGPPIARALSIPRMELMGAAWATILARLVVLAPTLWILATRFRVFDRSTWELPKPSIIGGIWAIAWPTSIQLVVRIVAMMLTHSLVARAFTTEQDQTATTALGIVFRLETMALFVGLGWGSAAQTFVGQSLGAGLQGRAKQSGYLAAGYNAIMMGVLAAMYIAWGAPITRFFDSDPHVVAMASHYLTWVAPSYVGLGIGIVLGSAIQGAGATRQTLILDLVVILGVQLPLSLGAVYGWALPPRALWQALAIAYVGYAIVYGVSYRRGRFLDTRI